MVSDIGAIVALSVGSAAVMQFKKGRERRRLLLPRRSLLILADEVRYCWYGIVINHCHYMSSTQAALPSTQPFGTRSL